MARRATHGPHRYQYELGKRKHTLVADIEDIISVCEVRMTDMMRQSLQDVVNDMQTPVAKGGKMRVDTGFLRASGQASLNGMPTGPGRGERKEPNSYPSPDDYPLVASVALALAQLKIGATFYFGWTANYARYREACDGFLEAALQNWQQIVDRNTNLIRERIKK